MSLLVLALGGAVAAAAGPAEDLQHAAMYGDAAAVQALLDQGADVNAKDAGGHTALMGASCSGRLDVMQALLAKGAEVNAQATDGRTALMQAAFCGNLGPDDKVQALLAKGADVNLYDSDGLTALALASGGIAQALLAKGAKPPDLVPLRDYLGRPQYAKDPAAQGYVLRRCAALFGAMAEEFQLGSEASQYRRSSGTLSLAAIDVVVKASDKKGSELQLLGAKLAMENLGSINGIQRFYMQRIEDQVKKSKCFVFCNPEINDKLIADDLPICKDNLPKNE